MASASDVTSINAGMAVLRAMTVFVAVQSLKDAHLRRLSQDRLALGLLDVERGALRLDERPLRALGSAPQLLHPFLKFDSALFIYLFDEQAIVGDVCDLLRPLELVQQNNAAGQGAQVCVGG